MNYLKIIVPLSLILLLTKCNKNKPESYQYYIKDTIPVNVYIANNYDHGREFAYFLDKKTNKEYFAYYNKKDSSIDFIEVKDTNVVKRFFLHFMLEKKNDDFAIVNFDSIIVSHFPRTIYIFTKENKYSYGITDSIPVYGDRYTIADNAPLWPLIIHQNSLYTYNFPEESIDNAEANKRYFSTPRETKLIFTGYSFRIAELSGRIHEYYKKNHNNVFCPIRTVGKNGVFIYSFEDSEVIIIYDPATKKYKTIKIPSPGFKTNAPFDMAKQFVRSYTSKHWEESDRFLSFLYDPFHQLYYRLLTKGIKYENDDGTVNLSPDKPFDVFIYDADFNLIRNISFPQKKYSFVVPYVTKNYFLLLTSNEYETKNRSFHAFSFN